MTLFDKVQPFLVLVSIVIGLILGQITWLTQVAPIMITPLLGLMLYATFLPIPLDHLERGLSKSQVVLASLAINFVWTPLFAWGLGLIFLQNHPQLWVGLIMLMVTPCTDWYLIFTAVAKGDVALALGLLPLNLILQILLATLSRQFILHWRGKIWLKQILSKITVFHSLCLNLAVVAIFVSQEEILTQNGDFLVQLLFPVMLFFVTNFLLAERISRHLQFSYPEFACFTCTTLARNSPLSLGIAASAFPEQPLISLTLVIGSLIELPKNLILALVEHPANIAFFELLIQLYSYLLFPIFSFLRRYLFISTIL